MGVLCLRKHRLWVLDPLQKHNIEKELQLLDSVVVLEIIFKDVNEPIFFDWVGLKFVKQINEGNTLSNDIFMNLNINKLLRFQALSCLKVEDFQI